MVDLNETLVIVTADHSHSFHLIGQPSRLESLLDLEKEYGKLVSHSGSLYLSYRLVTS